MSTSYKPNRDVPLALLPFLVNDTYGTNEDTGDISVTTLMKSVRKIVLSQRVPPVLGAIDPASLVASRRGTAVHDAIEAAWNNLPNLKEKLMQCGMPSKVIDAMVVNPPDGTDLEDLIPVYLEQRVSKTVNGVVITGKYDLILDGYISDIKNTSVFSYMSGSKSSDYSLQGSLYRWLNPDKVTEEHIKINFLFTDWSAKEAKYTVGYPQLSVKEVLYPLMSYQETQNWVEEKLNEIFKYYPLSEDELPLCTQEDLWQKDPVWKYYSKPDALRATKVFDSQQEAMQHYASVNKGEIKKVDGEARACNYCNAALICTQRTNLINAGKLEVTNG